MKNIWNAVATNEEMNQKFKGIIGDYLQNNETDALAQYLKELDCYNYYHEFVKRAILMGIEKVRSILVLNNIFRMRKE